MPLSELENACDRAVSVNDMSGPVGIVKKTIDDTYDESLTQELFYVAAMNMINIAILLSTNLGVMNLLPIPALDGGRLLFFFRGSNTRQRNE